MIIEDRTTYPNLVRRYSDRKVYIVNQDGEMYGEAVDRLDNPVVYTETDIPIEEEMI